MRGLTLTLLVVLGLAACSEARKANTVPFEGVQYRAKLAGKIDGQRNQFAVAVAPASAGLAGAREAARYEAIKYCITQYGSSDIVWRVGPEAPVASLAITDNEAHFRGACAYD